MVYLSLGSNVGDREAQLRKAILDLQSLGTILRVSAFYETEPVEYIDQPWFLNCVVAMETRLSPQILMKKLLSIEEEMGRRRIQQKGPRSIDIDILMFDAVVTKSKDLTIPHPAMHERRFVLEPMAEIAPEARHPLLHKSVSELLKELPPGQTVRRVRSENS